MQKKKTKLFTMKVKESELPKWHEYAKSKGMYLSDVIKDLMKGKDLPEYVAPKKVPKRKYTNVDPLLIRQLSAIGNNLNMISRRVNDRRAWENQKLDVAIELSAIEKQLERLLDVHKIQ